MNSMLKKADVWLFLNTINLLPGIKKSLLLARSEILNYTEVYLGNINNMIKERSNLLYVLSLHFLRYCNGISW